MNEELIIRIRAITEEAQRSLAQVREELDNIGNTSEEASSELDGSMKSMGKAAAAAAVAIAAATTAIVNLGKKSVEAQKQIGKLETAFLALGSSSEQALTTYRELYGFIGESDRSVEASQNLAKITTEEKALAEWTNILQGAFALMGDSLPVESLAEAANETIKVGQVTGTVADALNWMGVSEDEFNQKLAATTNLEEREILLRSTLNSLYSGAASIYGANNKALMEYNKSQADLEVSMANLHSYLTPLLTALNNLGSTLLTSLSPAIQVVCIYLTAFVQLIAEAIIFVSSFFGMFSSEADSATSSLKGYNSAMNSYLSSVGSYAGGASDGVEKLSDDLDNLKKQTMGFDELNIVQSPEASAAPGASIPGAAGGGLGLSPEAMGFNTGGIMDGALEKIEEAKEKIKSIGVLAGIAAAAFASWKLAKFIPQLTEALKQLKQFKSLGKLKAFDDIVGTKHAALLTQIKTMIGYFTIIAGALLTIKGYSDAWVDGVDWGNLAIVLAGLAVTISGIYLSFGKLAASISAVAAGVALMVLGVKDFIANGATLENTILIIGGAIAIAVGLATAGLSVLLSAIIAAVAAVAAFTAAILLEEPAIMTVEEAQENLTAAKEAAAAAELNYINAIDAAENALNRLQAAEVAAGMSGAELYAQVQSGAIDYANMTAEQRELYKAYLDNETKQKELKAATAELEAAKKAETIAAYENELALAKESGGYEAFKQSIIAAFEAGELSAEEARMLIGKSMSEMSDEAQQAFMEDIPDSIRDGLNPNEYETTRKKLGDFFKKVWKGIQDVFKSVGKWFSDVFTAAVNGIKKAFSTIGDFFTGIWNNIKSIFSKAGEVVGKAIKDTVSSAVNAVLSTAVKIINGFIKAINFAIDIINAIPGVSITRLSTLSVPKMAKGGIVDSATLAVVGEAGKEAVLPLENNTGWMDTLANRIAEKSSTPSKIVLKVDGKELGYATINSINNITKQTGELKLAII